MGNSALYSVSAAVGAAVLSSAAGYAFAKYEFTGKRLLSGAILGSVMIPTTALAIPTYLLFAKVDLVDTRWAIILPSVVSPFGTFLMRIYAAQAVDNSLIESARIDGAGELQIFFRVTSRLLAPGSVTVLLFTFVGTWNDYYTPLVMLDSPKYFPVTIGLDDWNGAANAAGGGQDLFAIVITGSLLSIIPLVAAFLLLQRFWQSGLATGAVNS